MTKNDTKLDSEQVGTIGRERIACLKKLFQKAT